MCFCWCTLQYVQGGAPTGKDSGGVNNLLASSSLAKMRADLSARWDELKTPAQERVQQLAGLLDSAAPSLATISIYEAISAKLADKAPIVQVRGSDPSFLLPIMSLYPLSCMCLCLCMCSC
ncbi:hypothetical protein EON63_00545 [archaeon]|nr:MAG: hypothetical protein EON63_00545 [archaeon]